MPKALIDMRCTHMLQDQQPDPFPSYMSAAGDLLVLPEVGNTFSLGRSVLVMLCCLLGSIQQKKCACRTNCSDSASMSPSQLLGTSTTHRPLLTVPQTKEVQINTNLTIGASVVFFGKIYRWGRHDP